MFQTTKNQVLMSIDRSIEDLENLKKLSSSRHSLLINKQLTALKSLYFEVEQVIKTPKP
jgi:hypothetical protein